MKRNKILFTKFLLIRFTLVRSEEISVMKQDVSLCYLDKEFLTSVICVFLCVILYWLCLFSTIKFFIIRGGYSVVSPL